VQYTIPSLPTPCSYVATQGPLPGTSVDFWGMVLELQVPAVVMLTNCAEGGVVKCSQYFPHDQGAVSRVGSYEIKVRFQGG
jgi:protein tyrosine phosphatase